MRQQALQRGQRHTRFRDVGEQPRRANRRKRKQQRAELLRYRQPQQQQAHQQHIGTACAVTIQPHAPEAGGVQTFHFSSPLRQRHPGVCADGDGVPGLHRDTADGAGLRGADFRFPSSWLGISSTSPSATLWPSSGNHLPDVARQRR